MKQNEETVRGIYTAVASHDAAGMLAALSSDVQFHIPGNGPIAGDHRGVEAIAALVQGVMSSTGGTFALDPISIVSNDRYVISLHRWTATRDSESIAMNNFNVWRFDDEGRVAERWEFLEDQAAHDAFWASAT